MDLNVVVKKVIRCPGKMHGYVHVDLFDGMLNSDVMTHDMSCSCFALSLLCYSMRSYQRFLQQKGSADGTPSL